MWRRWERKQGINKRSIFENMIKTLKSMIYVNLGEHVMTLIKKTIKSRIFVGWKRTLMLVYRSQTMMMKIENYNMTMMVFFLASFTKQFSSNLLNLLLGNLIAPEISKVCDRSKEITIERKIFYRLSTHCHQSIILKSNMRHLKRTFMLNMKIFEVFPMIKSMNYDINLE